MNTQEANSLVQLQGLIQGHRGHPRHRSQELWPQAHSTRHQGLGQEAPLQPSPAMLPVPPTSPLSPEMGHSGRGGGLGLSPGCRGGGLPPEAETAVDLHDALLILPCAGTGSALPSEPAVSAHSQRWPGSLPGVETALERKWASGYPHSGGRLFPQAHCVAGLAATP